MKRNNLFVVNFTNNEDKNKIDKKVLFNVNLITNMELNGDEVKVYFTGDTYWYNKGTASEDIYNGIHKVMEKGR